MKPSRSFYIKLYIFWVFWVSMYTLAAAFILSLVIAIAVYLLKGSVILTQDSLEALKEIVFLSFPVTFSISFILMLMLVFKAVFRHKIGGYTLKLYDCKGEQIKEPLLSDVMMLWRKWLFVTVWSILLLSVLVLGFYRLMTDTFPPQQWFNGINMYLTVIVCGGVIFVFGISKCKKVRISDG